MVNEETGSKYLEPNVYATPPPLLIAVDGTPSYGQIMLSETIAAFILVITSLAARGHIKKGQQAGKEGNILSGAFAMAVAYAAVKRMFRETSGGLANPCVALAIIVW